MTTYAALLRGVNVGGRNRISMAALRASLAAIGLSDVETYLQSGNAVFRSAAAAAETTNAIEHRLENDLGLGIAVLLRSARELVDIAGRNPFLTDEGNFAKLHVVFLDRAPIDDRVARLDPSRSPGDRFKSSGRELYLHLPNGAGRSKLTLDYFERALGVRGTARNWNTLIKLVELSGS